MLTYRAPIAEYQFALEHWLDVYADWTHIAAFSGLDKDTTQQILEQAAHFCTDKLLPINAAGDASGCQFKQGVVNTPPGYREAYRAFVADGWPTLCDDPQFGGQGLPNILNAALYEMMNATCHAWAMYPTLAHGAIACIRAHSSETLQSIYLPKLVSGEWEFREPAEREHRVPARDCSTTRSSEDWVRFRWSRTPGRHSQWRWSLLAPAPRSWRRFGSLGSPANKGGILRALAQHFWVLPESQC